MQCPSIGHKPTTTSAARRACRKLACCAHSRGIASAVAHARVPRTSRLCVGGRTWHIAPRPRAEGERPLAGAVPFHMSRTDHNQRGTARARSKLAYCASSREIASAAAHARVPRESRLCVGGRSWHVIPRPRAEGERPLAGAVHLHIARTDHNQRGTARARSKLACCASSREIASAVARARVPHESWLCIGGRSWHVAPRLRVERERDLAGAVPFHRM